VDPTELVEWVERAPRRLLPANVALYATATTSRRMSGDPALLQQAILNLVLNARDAMPDGGEVHVTAGDASGTDGRLAPQVQISVSDTGAPGEFWCFYKSSEFDLVAGYRIGRKDPAIRFVT